MRITALLPLFLLLAWPLSAQKVLQLEKYGSARTTKIFIGDPITYKLRGSETFNSGYIENIRLEDSLLVLADRYIHVYDITTLRYERAWPRVAGKSLFWFGSAWSGFAAVGFTFDGDPDTNYRWADAIVTLSSWGLSFAIPKLFGHKDIRIGKRRRLRLLDMRWKVEDWEK
ncbi:MAG: hypothetical protein KDD02_02170 [Phaeodactylibacter sp.]|nr:hypothetical protein [Phaeodactylibacter sp.]MCB9302290.1 hypothetical protein [Lewinellaceae bacterium]HQU60705.1 hypothetical protein [Saprospiraceae bacterium]